MYNSIPALNSSYEYTESRVDIPDETRDQIRKMNQNISLRKDGGLSVVGGYSHFILRPDNNTSVPRDIKRGAVGVEPEKQCNWPRYAGSKYQEWCDPKVATEYYAMRENMEPITYDNNLIKMFNKIVLDSTGNLNDKDIHLDTQYAAVACGQGTSQEDIMKGILMLIYQTVEKMPEMKRNGPYSTEQFQYTDVIMYKYLNMEKDNTPKEYFYVLFNLYNPLRSVSTNIYCVVSLNESLSGILIHRMSLINNKLSAAYDTNDDGNIRGHNMQPTSNKAFTVISQKDPTDVSWLYGNTLLDQQYNKYGFYDSSNNVKMSEVSVPDSLKARIKNFELNSTEYLFKAGKVGLTGIQYGENNTYKYSVNDGKPKTVFSDPGVIYNPQLLLNNQNKIDISKYSMNDNNKPKGYLYM